MRFPDMEEVHRAIHETVLEAGPKTLAHLMGMSHTALLNRSNPSDDTHRLNVEHFLQVLVHSNDMRALKAIADEFGYDLVPKEQVRPQNLTTALLHMSAEVADVTRAVADALEDGRVSQTEKQTIKRELQGARESLDVLEASVKVA
jgi:hypothetical protein